MIGLDYFLFGYFLVQVKEGEKSAALNLLLQRGISAHSLKNGSLIFKKKQRKNVEKALNEIECAVGENKGLPRFIYQNRKRYGIFIGVLLSLFLFALSSTHLWDVRVYGADEQVRQEAITALSEQGVFGGATFFLRDLSRLENHLLKTCPSIGWVDLHRRGTVLYANLIARTDSSLGAEGAVGNIIADESGVVVSVSPASGVACVKVGDAVEKGSLLISAVHKDGTLSGARGEVLGCVSGEISVSVGREETRTRTVKKKVCSVRIKIFDFSLNIFKNYGNIADGCDIIESERRISILGRYPIPISICRETAYSKETEIVRYSEAEAVSLAAVRLRAALSELLSKGEMRSMRTEGAWQGDRYVMAVRYEQLRNIGRLVPISIEEKK